MMFILCLYTRPSHWPGQAWQSSRKPPSMNSVLRRRNRSRTCVASPHCYYAVPILLPHYYVLSLIIHYVPRRSNRQENFPMSLEVALVNILLYYSRYYYSIIISS